MRALKTPRTRATCTPARIPCSPCSRHRVSDSPPFLSHFRASLTQQPVLAQLFERWCHMNNHSTWLSISFQSVTAFSDWLCDDAALFQSLFATSGEYGILKQSWANVLGKTFSVSRDTSGLSTTSPFPPSQHGLSDSQSSVICPSFSLHPQLPASVQYSLIFRDLILNQDKWPDSHQFFWFPSTLDPVNLWRVHFPDLQHMRFSQIISDAKGKSVFANCKEFDTRFTLWRLSPPHTAAYPDIAPLLHPLWSVTKEAGATVVSPAPTFQTLPREPHFPTIWESERANRRDLFAPKWNFKRRLMTTNIPWEKVYASWDRVNANIHLSTKKHVQKLAALRMTTASTKTSGTWIYAVWSLRDDKVYIGQTGARTHRRSVGKRGSEHVRLALDALRLSGTGINLPSQVYSWISRLGVENFVVTPLEHTTPHQANAREKWWMLRWGLAGLFNRDLPSLSNKKWLFLSDRKILQNEISAQGGSLLSMARNILQRKKPLSPHDYSPSLLLSVVSSTSRYLPQSQHRSLFDKVSQYFLVHHRVCIPYRIPVKIPLLTPDLKNQFSAAVDTAIDRHSAWPPHLRAYLKSRVQLIRSKTKTVSDILLKNPLTALPTSAISQDHTGPCPCHAWAHLPNVHMVNNHIVFRDPHVLRHMSPKIAPEVFEQNLQNASVPSWKGFTKMLHENQRTLHTAMPDARQYTSVDIMSDVLKVCEPIYQKSAYSHPKLVYEPFLRKQQQLIPSFIVPSALDKSPQVPIFACAKFWLTVNRSTFSESPRYQELLRFHSRDDASFSCLWHLTESMHLSVFGTPCQFTKTVGRTPLSPTLQSHAYHLHTHHPASRALKNRVSTLITAQCKKLTSRRPDMADQTTRIAFATHDMLPTRILKQRARTQTPAGSPIPLGAHDPPDPAHPPTQSCTHALCRQPPFSKPLPTPKCRILPKHKWREDVPGSKIKIREIIDHSNQPFKALCRTLGRSLTLLWKHACSRPSALESISMRDLQGFVNNLSHTPVSKNANWVELDLVEMFPNIPRDKVVTAVEFFWKLLCRDKQLPPKTAGFKIHKPGVRTIDAVVASGNSDSTFHFVPFSDLMLLLKWDLFFNDRFVHFTSVFRQTTGTAIGGATSAQTSSLTLLYMEESLNRVGLPPCFRYRDNFLLLIDPSPPLRSPCLSLPEVQDRLATCLGMELTVEGQSRTLSFLESQVSFCKGKPCIQVKTPSFSGAPGDPIPPAHKRLIDHHSPNAQAMLRSLVPNLVAKCLHYRSSHVSHSFTLNVCKVARTLLSKSYPVTRWKPLLLRKASTMGLESEALTGLQLSQAGFTCFDEVE